MRRVRASTLEGGASGVGLDVRCVTFVYRLYTCSRPRLQAQRTTPTETRLSHRAPSHLRPAAPNALVIHMLGYVGFFPTCARVCDEEIA